MHRIAYAATTALLLLALFLLAPRAAWADCPLPGVAAEALRPGRNVVARERLCPRLLKDGAALVRFLADFPARRYRTYAVPGTGQFLVDDGNDVIKSVLRRGHSWESDVEILLRRFVKAGTTVADIGAHIGTHAVPLGKLVGPTGRVYAFEPQRKIYRELVQNIRLNRVARNVIPLRFALGSKAAVIEMNPATKGNEGGTGIGKGGDKAELRTLDSFALRNVSLLKIDVEGFEDGVLDGARRTIARQHPIIIVEVRGGNDLDTAPLPIKRAIWHTVAKLVSFGYRVERATVHDYLALPRGTREIVAPVFTRRMAASKATFLTQIGQRLGGTLSSVGRRGSLLYGPYEYLPAGSYLVRWFGRVTRSGSAHFDIASNKGTIRHGAVGKILTVGPARELAAIALTSAHELLDTEYRVVVVDPQTGLSLTRVEVHQLQTQP